jgi:4-hydroxy-tetrahydrodipicolinate synthase
MNALRIPEGALTALVTPFKENGEIDWFGLRKLIEFQMSQGISGIIPVGTTGETSTLQESEHDKIIRETASINGLFVMPGCGSNNTVEGKHYVGVAARNNAPAVLMVDPYYSKPPSLWIMRYYLRPIAEEFNDLAIVPYIIPGRTGGKGLLPHDLATLSREFPNVCAVKEATGDWNRMEQIRSLAPDDFQIFSGDDEKTFTMMSRRTINACGVISVASNIAPAAVQAMCSAVLNHHNEAAEAIRDKLSPLFEIVTVTAPRTVVDSSGAESVIEDVFPNPSAIKVAMNVLGMPSGPCREPLGKMTSAGMHKVREALSKVWLSSPEILSPIEEFFGINIGERLANEHLWESLSY